MAKDNPKSYTGSVPGEIGLVDGLGVDAVVVVSLVIVALVTSVLEVVDVAKISKISTTKISDVTKEIKLTR